MNSQIPNDTKTTGARPAEKISPQNIKGSQAEDRTPNGDTSRGVDEGAIEIGATGKRGQFGG
jgi:hypothetical protein